MKISSIEADDLFQIVTNVVVLKKALLGGLVHFDPKLKGLSSAASKIDGNSCEILDCHGPAYTPAPILENTTCVTPFSII